MKKLISYVIIIIFTILSGCQQNTSNEETVLLEKKEEQVESDLHQGEQVEIVLWAPYKEGWDYAIEAFESQYPNIQITLKAFSYESYEEVYMNALLQGDVPDIMLFSSDHFGGFTDLNVFQDLKEDPFSVENYKEDMPDSLWRLGSSFDQEKVIGVPLSTSPKVTYYRPDLLERYGYPTDPETLGEYLEDEDNWLDMARTLKKDDIWISQWPSEIVSLFTLESGLFSEDMEFLRTTETVEHAINLSKKIQQEQLTPGYDIYQDEGQTALKADKFAMIYQGTWGEDQINSIAPEQAGKWRVTRLPFNLYGWTSSNIFSIPAESQYKEEAWKFIKFYTFELTMMGFTGSVPSYLPAREVPATKEHQSEFLGGQFSQKMYQEISAKTRERRLTPIDRQAEEIWSVNLEQGIAWDIDAREIIDEIHNNIEAELGREINILQQYSQKSNNEIEIK